MNDANQLISINRWVSFMLGKTFCSAVRSFVFFNLIHRVLVGEVVCQELHTTFTSHESIIANDLLNTRL